MVPSIPVAYGALAVLLIASMVFPPAMLVSVTPWVRWLAAVLYVGLPVLFASFIFSAAYGAERSPTTALAFNILGAVGGGVLEYTSMAFGLGALNWLVLALYGTAVLLLTRSRRSAAPLPA